VVDEDDSYVWVMCSARSASIVENFDIESAVQQTSFLFDNDTLIWLIEVSMMANTIVF
jgi:hypothetical protein